MNAFIQIYATMSCENSFKVIFYLLVIIELQPKNNPFDAWDIAEGFCNSFILNNGSIRVQALFHSLHCESEPGIENNCVSMAV